MRRVDLAMGVLQNVALEFDVGMVHVVPFEFVSKFVSLSSDEGLKLVRLNMAQIMATQVCVDVCESEREFLYDIHTHT